MRLVSRIKCLQHDAKSRFVILPVHVVLQARFSVPLDLGGPEDARSLIHMAASCVILLQPRVDILLLVHGAWRQVVTPEMSVRRARLSLLAME